MAKSLLDGDGDASGLQINKKFAEKYAEKKKREELSILEDRYKEKLAKKGVRRLDGVASGSDLDDEETDSESEEEEDEDGELVTPAIDAQLLKALADIRAHDDKIYDSSRSFFSQEELEKAKQEWMEKMKDKKEKPMKLKDYHRERLLNGIEGEENAESGEQPIKTHEEEQAEILRDFQNAAFKDADAGEEDGDDLLQLRPKTVQDIEREEEEYKNFLLENLSANDNARESMQEWFARGGKSGTEINNEDQFLIEYILSRGWIEKDRKSLPSYEQIIGEDEEAVEKAEEFEERYNFRFEQPGGAEIVTYAREIEGSLRQEQNSRKEKRAAKNERKTQEKARQQEELKRLKNLKKQEIQEKLKRIAEISGNAGVEDAEIGLESDFDPEEHDRKMKKLFDDSYYDVDDDKKPTWSDDDEDLALPEDPIIAEKIIKKATKAVSKSANIRDDKKKRKLGELLDQYYEMDYEDMIGGDLPCRFKYQKVAPTTFGLNMDDILRADDTELNEYVSLKKLAPYRQLEVINYDENKIKSNKKKIYKFYDLLRRKELGTGLNDSEMPPNSLGNGKKKRKKTKIDLK